MINVTPLPSDLPAEDEFALMTIRSEGQFNTVVYEAEDLYRGNTRRDVVMMSEADAKRLGVSEGDRVTGRAAQLTNDARGCSGAAMRVAANPNASANTTMGNIVPCAMDSKGFVGMMPISQSRMGGNGGIAVCARLAPSRNAAAASALTGATPIDDEAAPGDTPAKAVVALEGAFEGARAMISSWATTRAASGA